MNLLRCRICSQTWKTVAQRLALRGPTKAVSSLEPQFTRLGFRSNFLVLINLSENIFAIYMRTSGLGNHAKGEQPQFRWKKWLAPKSSGDVSSPSLVPPVIFGRRWLSSGTTTCSSSETKEVPEPAMARPAAGTGGHDDTDIHHQRRLLGLLAQSGISVACRPPNNWSRSIIVAYWPE